MTLAPRLKPIKVTGRRPWGRRTRVSGRAPRWFYRTPAPKGAALAHSSGPAMNAMKVHMLLPPPELRWPSQESQGPRHAGAHLTPESAASTAHRQPLAGLILFHLKPSSSPISSAPGEGLICLVANDCREVGPFWSREQRGKVPQMRREKAE